MRSDQGRAARTCSALLIFVVLLAAPLGSSAQILETSPRDGVIERVDIRFAGVASISPDDVLSLLNLCRAGKVYSEAAKAVEELALMKSGRFEKVSIAAEAAGRDLIVSVTVQVRITVRRIDLKGCNPEYRKGLLQGMSTKEGSVLSEAAVERDRDFIAKHLQKVARADFYVAYRILPEKYAADVEFVLEQAETNNDPPLGAIRFEGNATISRQNLVATMLNVKIGKQLDRDQLRKDLDAIRDFYQENGCYYAEIVQTRTEPSGSRSLTLVIVVNEGQQYEVSRVDLEGNSRIPESELRLSLTLEPKMLLRPSLIRSDIRALESLYRHLGLSDANVRFRLDRAIDGNTVVVFVIDEGRTMSVAPTLIRRKRFTR